MLIRKQKFIELLLNGKEQEALQVLQDEISTLNLSNEDLSKLCTMLVSAPTDLSRYTRQKLLGQLQRKHRCA